MKYFIFVLTLMTLPAQGQVTSNAAKKTPSQAAASSAKSKGLVPSTTPSLLSTPIRKPATLDPNSAIEVRGQARTLSMMLVLKNGKDSINFIKVRKDYKSEIPKTEY